MKIKDIPGCKVVFGRPMHRLVKPPVSASSASAVARTSASAATRTSASAATRTSAPAPAPAASASAPAASATAASTSAAPQPTLTRAIKPAAINDGYIDLGSIEEQPFYSTPPADSFTCEGDVVLKLSAPFSAALVGPEEAGLFVPSSCAILRLGEEGRALFDPGYIAGFINLPLINESLRSQASGSKVLILNSMQVSEIDITQLPLAQQQRISRLVGTYVKRLKLRKSLNEVEGQIVEAVFAEGFQEAR